MSFRTNYSTRNFYEKCLYKVKSKCSYFLMTVDNARKEECKPNITLTGQAGRWSDAGGNDAVNSSPLAENSSITQFAEQRKWRISSLLPFIILFSIFSRHILSDFDTLLLSSSWFEKITLLLIDPTNCPSILSVTAFSSSPSKCISAMHG